MSSTALITLDNLTIKSPAAIYVNPVTLTIEKGEIMALVGESGSGKTLTALAIMDLLPGVLRKEGTITFAGHDLSTLRHFRGKDIGMIFQEPMTSLNPLHFIGKQIAEAVRIHQKTLDKKAVYAKVLALLDAVGLGYFKDRLNAYPDQLSGGERQRVMIAMAIANSPSLLIADEPTTALDVTIAAQILELLVDLRAKTGMAILFITHDLHSVKRIADRVAVMKQGNVVESGTVAEVFTHPAHDYTRSLLAAKPKKKLAPAPENTELLLECNHLKVRFAEAAGIFTWHKHYKNILNNIQLSVAAGTTLGIVGESGSGKTTLALALLRLVQSEGELVWHFGSGQSETRKLRRFIQIVFQDPFSSLNPRMMIGDSIREGLDVHFTHLSKSEREAQLDSILQEVGLEPGMKQRFPHEFSGGQRQRISIARALILKPKLIILDEPTSALDISVQAQILDLLLGLQEKHGLSYLFISHDLRTVRAMSHNLLVLRKGEMIEYGTTEQIFTQPKEDYTRNLIQSALLGDDHS